MISWDSFTMMSLVPMKYKVCKTAVFDTINEGFCRIKKVLQQWESKSGQKASWASLNIDIQNSFQSLIEDFSLTHHRVSFLFIGLHRQSNKKRILLKIMLDFQKSLKDRIKI